MIGAAVSVALVVWPLGHNPFGPPKLVATFVAGAISCYVLATTPGARSRLAASLRSPVARAMLVLAGIFLLSLVTTADIRLALAGNYPGYLGLLTGAAWLAIALGVMSLSPRAVRVASGRVGIVTLGIVSGYAVLQRFGIEPMRLAEQLDLERTGALLGNAANMGAFIAIGMPLLLDRAHAEESRRWRQGALNIIGLSTLASVFSGSRGAWLGLVAGIAVWLLVSRRPEADRQRFVVAGLVVLVLVVGLAFTPSSASRLIGGGTASATAQGRLAVWGATASMVLDRPVLGWGVAAFGRVFPRYATVATVDPTGRTQLLDDPHNVFGSVAASTGTAGVAALLALLAAAALAIRRGSASREVAWIAALAGGLTGGLVALQFHFVTLETGALLAILLGGLAAAGDLDAAADDSSVTLAWVPFGVLCVLAVLSVGLTAADSSVRAGFAASTSGDTESAMEAFDRAERFAFWEPAIGWGRGRALIGPVAAGSTDALDAGIAALTRASLRMPGDARPLRDLGDMYVAASTSGIGEPSPASALDAYDSAIEAAPLDPRAWLGRGVALSLAGDLSSAERDILQAVELAPAFADAWENLAAVYDAMGDTARADTARGRAAAARR